MSEVEVSSEPMHKQSVQRPKKNFGSLGCQQNRTGNKAQSRLGTSSRQYFDSAEYSLTKEREAHKKEEGEVKTENK